MAARPEATNRRRANGRTRRIDALGMRRDSSLIERGADNSLTILNASDDATIAVDRIIGASSHHSSLTMRMQEKGASDTMELR